jgi:hypothetical protein
LSTPFSDDDGSADPRIEAALAAFERGEGGAADVLAALAAGRLLVPVVPAPVDAAPRGETEEKAPVSVPSLDYPVVDEHQVSKHADLATVSMVGRDGRRGLLAFTSVEALARWNAQARPTPVPTRRAAEAALADGADALVIDLAGPVVFPIDDRNLRSLAAGWRPLSPWPDGARRDEV